MAINRIGESMEDSVTNVQYSQCSQKAKNTTR
nr:MAG TPA: hypothetical protein [Bacteriophage sp.]